MAEDTFEIPKCPQCGRKNIRHRVTTRDSVCNLCGHEWADEPAKVTSVATGQE